MRLGISSVSSSAISVLILETPLVLGACELRRLKSRRNPYGLRKAASSNHRRRHQSSLIIFHFISAAGIQVHSVASRHLVTSRPTTYQANQLHTMHKDIKSMPKYAEHRCYADPTYRQTAYPEQLLHHGDEVTLLFLKGYKWFLTYQYVPSAPPTASSTSPHHLSIRAITAVSKRNS